MRISTAWRLIIVVALAVAVGAPAGAQLTPAEKCEKLKNKAVGKRVLCTMNERGKEIAGKPFDYAKCTLAMASAFARYESKADGACPSSGDAAVVEARINELFDPSSAIPLALSGVRFVDNGDGTVTDTQTGLMWEKKNTLDDVLDLSNPHDADNLYTWSASPPQYEAPTGTAYSDALYELNDCIFTGLGETGGFAGHCDWRLPTMLELRSIWDRTQPGCDAEEDPVACIDPIFGPTALSDSSLGYWSSLTGSFSPDTASVQNFTDCNDCWADQPKSQAYGYVRAVRKP